MLPLNKQSDEELCLLIQEKGYYTDKAYQELKSRYKDFFGSIIGAFSEGYKTTNAQRIIGKSIVIPANKTYIADNLESDMEFIFYKLTLYYKPNKSKFNTLIQNYFAHHLVRAYYKYVNTFIHTYFYTEEGMNEIDSQYLQDFIRTPEEQYLFDLDIENWEKEQEMIEKIVKMP